MKAKAQVTEDPVRPSQRHPRWQLAIELAVGYLASWAVGVGFGFILKSTFDWSTGARWERDTLVWVHERPLPAILDSLMLAMPYLGTNLTILPLMLVVGLVLWKKFKQPLIAVQFLTLSIGSLSLNPTMKHLLNRDRPALFPLRGMWTWASYPSGHVILTPALYFTISFFLYRHFRWRWPFVVSTLVVCLTAYSRLYLAVHWPTDLIGGVLIGVTWLFSSWFAFDGYRKRTAAGHWPEGKDRLS